MKDLEFIRKHVKVWPEGATTVRLDKDGEICFMGGELDADFYPDGYDISMFNVAKGVYATGKEYSHDEWSHRGLIDGTTYDVTFMMYDEDSSTYITTMSLTCENGEFNHPSGVKGTYMVEDTKDENQN